MPRCGLYIHVPFCEAKCGYCDFYSFAAHESVMPGLVDRLLAELEMRLQAFDDTIESVFLGGGTPTVLPPEQLRRLAAALGEIACRSSCREFTVEANPGSLDHAKAHILVDAGLTRLSLGAQSFRLDELSFLDRVHSPENIGRAVRIARDAGISNLNLDLIFGIPGQTLSSWTESLRLALDLGPEHLALYGLTYEAGTALTRRRDSGTVTPCDDDLEARMYVVARDLLARNGFEHYEISNYARPGRRCLHNLLYWNNQPYIGVGPSAVGCIDGVRYRNVPNANRYVEMIDRQGHAVIESERVQGPRLAAEQAMLQLRLVEGIDTEVFAERTGLNPMTTFARAIQKFEPQGLLRIAPGRIALTDQGRMFADTIITEFMIELDDINPEVLSASGISLPVLSPVGSPA